MSLSANKKLMDVMKFDNQHLHSGVWEANKAPYVFVNKSYVKRDVTAKLKQKGIKARH